MVINIKAAVTRRYDCTIEMIARLIIIGLPHTMNLITHVLTSKTIGLKKMQQKIKRHRSKFTIKISSEKKKHLQILKKTSEI